MKASIQSFVAAKAFPGNRILKGLGLLLALLLLPALLTAQDVPYTIQNVGWNPGGPYYSDDQRYVIWQSDFGFFYLDTQTLIPGHVQVENKCGFNPTPVTGFYVHGDCNGIASVRTSGGFVEAMAAGGNCAAGYHDQNCSSGFATIGKFFFSVGGAWPYLGDQHDNDPDIPNGTKTKDSAGRTWVFQPLGGGNFNWHSTGNPNAPPVANASAVNNSAASRTDKTNYFGDSWTLTDTSASIAPITSIQWDFNYVASFVEDFGPEGPGQTHVFPFPCAGGSISTPSNCWASVGGPTTSGSYQFALKADNGKPGSPTQFTSNLLAVAIPKVGINGNQLSCGTHGINVLAGLAGNADASTNATGGTQGSPSAWAWTFAPSGSSNSPAATVPTNATSYTLAVTWSDGYACTVQGAVTQVDLVPAFTLSPNPILLNNNVTLTNKMQKGSATLNDAKYQIGLVGVACDGRTAINSMGTLPSSFLAANGTTTFSTSPNTNLPGSYCMYVQYDFTDHNLQAQSLVAQNQFSAISWAPNPSISISPLPICTATCGLTVNTTYTLADGELPLQLPEDAKWELVNGSTATTIATTTSSLTNSSTTWRPTSACPSNCSIRLTVPSAGPGTTSLPVTISTSGGGGGGGGLSVSVSGPNSLSIGQSGTFSANVSGGNGSITYAWQTDDVPIPVTGGQTFAHAWTSSGSHSITVSVTQGSSNGSGVHSVSITGTPAPSGSFTIAPSQVSGTTYTVGRGQVLTFTASELNAAQWGWDFGDGTAAGGSASRVVQKVYSTMGTYNCVLIVYPDNIHNAGITTVNFSVVVGAPQPSPAFTVTGAPLDTSGNGSYDAEVGNILTFTAQEQNASAYSWDFGDGNSATGPVATHAYTAVATETVTLTVTGDGVNNNGTTSGTAVINVNPSSFHAMIVPGVAHLDDGVTTWGTDVSITNAGVGSMNISLAFFPLLSDTYAPSTLDLSQLTYGTPITIVPGGTYSVAEVVTALNGGNSKGTLVIKYSGGSDAPLVSTRVYFAPKVNPTNISYGSGLPAYQVDATGNISPQGYSSVELGGNSSSVSTQSTQAVESVNLTVTFAGTGSGTITSNPAGMSCTATCTGTFASGTAVLLNGAAASGSKFVSITGCDSYPTGTCAVTLTSNKTVTATFSLSSQPPPPGSASLSVTKTGTGTGTVSSSPAGIACGATCSSSYTQGTAVTLSAAADSGSTFTGWSGGGCSGTGTCVVTLSVDTVIAAGFSTVTSTTQGDQVLIGLRSDPQYRFGVTLFNAAGAVGTFRLSALDEGGSAVLISDGIGGQVAYRDFTVRPYQQIYLKNDDLGLTDINKRYVVKGQRTSSTGLLLAFGTALDRTTNDFIQVTDDSQSSPAETGIVSYWVAGVSRYDTTYGAHWRTDLRIYNRGSSTRNLYFDYTYLSGGASNDAHVNQIPIGPGELLTYDDVINALMSQDATVNLTGSNSGFLRIYYPEDSESATRPLIIGSRNYDDQSTGTAGSQLAVYTHNQSANTGQRLVLTGAQESDQYTSKIGVFAMDPGPISLRISAIAPDGTVIGSLITSFGGGGPMWGQLSLTDLPGFTNPGVPVSIQIDQVNGGRVGAYAFTVDKTTLDTTFIQALPQ